MYKVIKVKIKYFDRMDRILGVHKTFIIGEIYNAIYDDSGIYNDIYGDIYGDIVFYKVFDSNGNNELFTKDQLEVIE